MQETQETSLFTELTPEESASVNGAHYYGHRRYRRRYYGHYRRYHRVSYRRYSGCW